MVHMHDGGRLAGGVVDRHRASPFFRFVIRIDMSRPTVSHLFPRLRFPVAFLTARRARITAVHACMHAWWWERQGPDGPASLVAQWRCACASVWQRSAWPAPALGRWRAGACMRDECAPAARGERGLRSRVLV